MDESRGFQFKSAAVMARYTGYRADNLRTLLRWLKRVPGSSIFYHVHHALFRRHTAAAAFVNDFARWAWTTLHEETLAERLAILDPLEFGTVRAVRDAIVEVVEHHVGAVETIPHVPGLSSFFFQEARSVVFPTGVVATSLRDFAAKVRTVGPDSIFHHFVVAPLRVGPKENDFSKWIERECGAPEIAGKLRELSPYSDDLFDLRERIGDLVALYL
ncbi:hypothetical protein AKJ08_2262 [Vulgatibacter incomptus]|uniref:Uncharacterized protein n=2 Tax=Vulgatibacter incomptus TaxID=1391653 RepID=A0A0K1PED5_9BACT|nr:DUF5752 family protein [Vulgatibacter incomptus]AKU91875.1 hypothetical protein AKJ08_2262 [Vulgatibacter incomptus]